MTIRPRMFVLIDALGWEYLKDREFLSDICPYRTPLRTVLGFSSGAIPSLLTGTLPQSHGHWNLFYYDPEGSPLRWVRARTFRVVIEKIPMAMALRQLVPLVTPASAVQFAGRPGPVQC